MDLLQPQTSPSWDPLPPWGGRRRQEVPAGPRDANFLDKLQAGPLASMRQVTVRSFVRQEGNQPPPHPKTTGFVRVITTPYTLQTLRRSHDASQGMSDPVNKQQDECPPRKMWYTHHSVAQLFFAHGEPSTVPANEDGTNTSCGTDVTGEKDTARDPPPRGGGDKA